MRRTGGPDKRVSPGSPTVREALLSDPSPEGVRCGLCHQRCLVREGERGVCGTRVNIEGKLQTVVYGDIVSCQSRPVEVKPLFHFHPGKTLMTFCCPGCNLRCPWCQNHSLSRADPRPLKADLVRIEEITSAAEAAGDSGVCASFTEPTLLFEYCLGLFREVRERGMVNTMVTNGYMTPEALHMLCRAGLDAMSVDVKGSDAVYRDYCQAPDGALPVWENIRAAIEAGIHVEVVHLAVTGLNDDMDEFADIVEKHLEYAGRLVPLHITAYRPAYLYHRPPTPGGFLEEAYRLARDRGVAFPYLGNVPGHPYQNTFCPECEETVLTRSGYRLESDMTDDHRCPACGYRLQVVD